VTDSDVPEVPAGLGEGGSELWSAIVAEHALDAAQSVQLLEACRSKDRLDKLDAVLRGDGSTWMRLTYRLRSEDEYDLHIDDALTKANATANQMKQLLAALRLPDAATGKKPQYRGARGALKPSVPSGGKVTAMDKFRKAAGG
jgi:hypothetical protein